MSVVQQGNINTTALDVPDLYVQIVPPGVQLLNGVPTNIQGYVGIASWGPKNAPVPIGDDYVRLFGTKKARKHDLATHLDASIMQGAKNFRGVRVTDGTDVAASVAIQTNCLTLTSKYTGSEANGDKFILGNGSQVNTYSVTLARAGLVPEVFDNIAGSGNTFWQNVANAINNGQSGLRGPSELMVATAGVGTAAPVLATSTLAGGTDGATTITASVLLGVDTTPRTGMYALRKTGASIGVLCDCDDSTSWADQVAFGLSEGIYMIGVGPSGDTVSNAVSVKATAGIDSYAFKLMHGDWIYVNDNVNNVQRLVPPQAFEAGRLANLSPAESSLNKPIYGVVATQTSKQSRVYSGAELQALSRAGIDLICNPVPGGNYFGVRFGRNTSSNPVIHGDNYTRMTNYIAYTLDAGMGWVVGKNQSSRPDDKLRREAKVTLDSFLQGMVEQEMIDGFSVKLDLSNNPENRQALGYMQADVKVRYLNVVEYFIVNAEMGGSVTITRQSTNLAA